MYILNNVYAYVCKLVFGAKTKINENVFSSSCVFVVFS